jgi:hypothetical protein
MIEPDENILIVVEPNANILKCKIMVFIDICLY